MPMACPCCAMRTAEPKASACNHGYGREQRDQGVTLRAGGNKMHANGSARRSRAADSLEASGFHGRTCLPQSFLCIIMQKNTGRRKGQEGCRGDCGSVRYDPFVKYFGTAASRCVQRECGVRIFPGIATLFPATRPSMTGHHIQRRDVRPRHDRQQRFWPRPWPCRRQRSRRRIDRQIMRRRFAQSYFNAPPLPDVA